MRYERKFILNEFEINPIIAKFISQDIEEIFPERYISSIYYDTPDFYLYRISEYGNHNRFKIRIRWYNENRELKLEYKMKNGEVGEKKINEINNNESENKKVKVVLPFSQNIYISQIPESINRIYSPVLCVNYKRKYFSTKSRNIRFTLDYFIKFSRINYLKDHFIFNNWVPSREGVLEIKYDQSLENVNPMIQNTLEGFNLNLDSFSKYCKGISTSY